MSTAAKGSAVRAEAARAVDAVVTQGRSLQDALAEAELRTPAADQSLLRMLSYGVLRHHWQLRAYLGALLDKPLKRRDSVVESLMAVGLFQLVSSRVPDHAAVSLTVEATRQLRRPKFAPVVNGVLRNFRRQGIAEREPPTDEARFNHPDWVLRRLQQDWPDRWRDIVEANNARAPMWLRVNHTRMTTEKYCDHLAREGAAYTTLDGLEQAICLQEPRPVAELPGFEAGWVSVQDAAAQLAAPWLLATRGRRILDACAAPGGKAAHLLELAGPEASLTALDLDEKRLATSARNLERLGFGATLLAADASDPAQWWNGQLFDHILLDAPCSATGVIRRHPDIRLLRREADIASSASLQQKLLESLWPLLAPGGRLLYVTCSVLSAENEAVAGRFLHRHPDGIEEQLLPNYNIRDLMCRRTCGYQVVPGTRGLDGFYFACLRKTGPITG
ncbi:MAG: 16S rRNA (cytosine(967)-C(5))-methyltransferase RsmB [Woeseia sp.]